MRPQITHYSQYIHSIPPGSDAIVVADNGETLLTKAEVEEFGCTSEPLKCSQKGKHSQKQSTTVRPLSSDFVNDDDESDTAQDRRVSTSSGSTWVPRESCAESAFPIGGGCQVSTAGGSTQVLSGSHSSSTFPIPTWVGSSESTFGLPRDLSVPTSSGLGSSYMGQPSVPSNNSAPPFSKPPGYGPPMHFLMDHHHYSPYQLTARPNDVNGLWIGYNGMFRQQAECFVYNNT